MHSYTGLALDGCGEGRLRRRRPASTIAIPYCNCWPHLTIPVIVPALEFSLNEKKAVISCIFNTYSQIRFIARLGARS